MTVNPRRGLLWLIIASLFFWILSRNPLAQLARIAIFSDFMGYWSSTRLFLAGSNPYNNTNLSVIFAQYNRSISPDFVTWAPPWIYLVLTPFAMLDITTARFLWFVLNCTIILSFADCMWRRLGGPAGFRPRIMLSAILFPPSALALHLGQTSPLLLAGFLGFSWALSRGHFFVAGLSTYMLMAKPHVVYLFWYVLVLWLIENRNYRMLLGTAVAITIPTAFGFLVNPSVYYSYFVEMQAHQGPLMWATPTLGTILRMCFGSPSTLVQLTPTAFGLAFATFLWMKWRRGFVWDQHGIEILLISTITSIYAWTFDWLILLPALFTILARACRNWRSNLSWIVWCVVIQVILFVQVAVQRDYIVTAWFPFAMAVMYWVFKNKGGSSEELNMPPAALPG